MSTSATASPQKSKGLSAKTVAIKVGEVLLWLIYIWLMITLVLLLLAFILELFGANPTAGFVEWVYRSTQRAMAPFRGIFEPVQLSDQSTLDTSILFAMIIYGLVAIALHAAIQWVTGRAEAADADAKYQQMLAAQAHAVSPSSGRVVHLTGPTGAIASAVLTTRGGITYVDLTATGLDPSQSYGVWLQGNDGARASAGTFQPAGPGTVRIALTSAAQLSDALMFGVSTVPQPGESTGIDILATRL